MTDVILGTGILNWPSVERRSDRYGYVHLYTDVIPLDVSTQDDPTYVSLTQTQGKGQLIARILATRQSQHIGDLFRGFFPSTPTVDEEIILGTGTVDYEGYEVGLRPCPHRETDWLDPRQLYRCHEQTVQLLFRPIT
jgi:hypothetical protein